MVVELLDSFFERAKIVIFLIGDSEKIIFLHSISENEQNHIIHNQTKH